MTTQFNPYLSFRDTTSDAMDFYQAVFGGELTKSTFGEMHASEDPAEQDKIMHSTLVTEQGWTLMASDTPNHMDYSTGTNFALSLSGKDEGELRGYWDKLSGSGTVTMPFEKAPWGDLFGMCVDKFGVSWLVDAVADQPSS
jgi:PhnB protein